MCAVVVILTKAIDPKHAVTVNDDKLSLCLTSISTHMAATVQCQSDGCSFSGKDGAVVWQSLVSSRQVVSPSLKWRLMTAALLFKLEPSV